MNYTYVRWQRDEPRAQRPRPPLTEEHPCYLLPCGYCANQLGGGGSAALVVIGPDDLDALRRHEEGDYYSALAVLCHALCIAKLTNDELDEFATALLPEEVK